MSDLTSYVIGELNRKPNSSNFQKKSKTNSRPITRWNLLAGVVALGETDNITMNLYCVLPSLCV